MNPKSLLSLTDYDTGSIPIPNFSIAILFRIIDRLVHNWNDYTQL